MTITAFAPGRVNLIGDHTDYTGGLAMPMAIDLGTSVSGVLTEPDHRSPSSTAVIELCSPEDPDPAVVPADITIEALDSLQPRWARYVAGVVHEVRPSAGFTGSVTTTLPVGAGLSSSAALELATALAIGFSGTARELAALCQRAEQVASGVPCGIMDQLASACGVEGHALLMNFTSLTVEPVAVPDAAEVVVVHSRQERALVDSAYAERRASCERAGELIGPLLEADLGALSRIEHPIVRRRARHVITENDRVRDFARALRAGDLSTAGHLMSESHLSLRDDFEVSTPTLDAVAARLRAVPGVHGARLTGAGFGGCVVALTDPGVLDEGQKVHASGPAHLRSR